MRRSASQLQTGIFLSYLNIAAQALVSLIYTPFMLRILGQGEYGLYELSYAFISYLNLLSFGFNSAYLRFYSRLRAVEGEQAAASLNGMFLTVFACLAGLCAVLGAILTANAGSLLGAQLTGAELGRVRRLMALMVLNLCFTFLSSVLECFLTAHERYAFQRSLVVLYTLLQPCLSLPLLLLGLQSVSLAAAAALLSALRLVAEAVYCARRLHLPVSFHGMRFSLLREIAGFSFFIFLNMLVDQLGWAMDKFILGLKCGPEEVAVYAVACNVSTLYLMLSTSLSSVFAPRVNIMAALEQSSRLFDLFTRVGRLQCLVLGLFLSAFVLFGQPFLTLWAGPEYGSSYPTALLLMGASTVPLIQDIGAEILRAENRHRFRAVMLLICAAGNACLTVPLSARYGAQGAAFATLIAALVGNVGILNWYYRARLGFPMRRYWKSLASLLAPVLASLVLGASLAALFPVDGLVQLLAFGAIYAGIYAALVYAIGMNEDEKRLVHTLVRSFLKR